MSFLTVPDHLSPDHVDALRALADFLTWYRDVDDDSVPREISWGVALELVHRMNQDRGTREANDRAIDDRTDARRAAREARRQPEASEPEVAAPVEEGASSKTRRPRGTRYRCPVCEEEVVVAGLAPEAKIECKGPKCGSVYTAGPNRVRRGEAGGRPVATSLEDERRTFDDLAKNSPAPAAAAAPATADGDPWDEA